MTPIIAGLVVVGSLSLALLYLLVGFKLVTIVMEKWDAPYIVFFLWLFWALILPSGVGAAFAVSQAGGA